MRAWAAPVIDGIRQDHLEVELETNETTVLEHRLPWAKVAYRYEYEPGEDIPTVVLTSTTRTEEELPPAGPRWWRWLTGSR